MSMLGVNVDNLLGYHGMTQQELADAAGISSRGKFSHWKLKTHMKVNPEDIKKVAKVFGYSPEELTETTIVVYRDLPKKRRSR